MIKNLLTIATVIAATSVSYAGIKAQFTADEASKVLLKNGFDTQADFNSWSLNQTNADNTWHIVTKPRINGIPDFSSINSSSKNSLAIWYDTSVKQDETTTSPQVEVIQGAKASFYAAFDGVYIMYANLVLNAIDEENVTTKLFDAFSWSQESMHERPKWLPFSVDLTPVVGKKVKFAFNYKGINGDDVIIDDFLVSIPDSSDTAMCTIKEGEEIHFKDLSTDEPTSWSWTFEGADESTSNVQNPVIKYSHYGTYKVTLVAKNANSEDTSTREGFVVVKGSSPVASIGLPAEGYKSPNIGVFIPVNKEVTYNDLSTGNPTSWAWQLPNSSSPTSTEQNPKVSYPKEGVYSVGMRASNTFGTDASQFNNAIQVGGTQNIWNIDMSETESLAPIEMSWYGNYGGSNFMDIEGFGEYFQKPLAKGSISAVDVYFAKIGTISPDSLVTVSLMDVKDGLPGSVLTSTKMKVSAFVNNYVPTTFTFDTPVEISQDFFVAICGFPHETNEQYESDDIAMYCVRRDDLSKGTTYNYNAILDEKYQPTGEFEWVKNVDDAVSFAIAPKFTFIETSGIAENIAEENSCNLVVADGMLRIFTSASNIELSLYNMQGQFVASTTQSQLSVDSLESGIYVAKVVADGKIIVKKIKI